MQPKDYYTRFLLCLDLQESLAFLLWTETWYEVYNIHVNVT